MFEMLSRPKPVETVLELSRPVEAQADLDRREDYAAPARGIIMGIVISAAVWAAIIAALI